LKSTASDITQKDSFFLELVDFTHAGVNFAGDSHSHYSPPKNFSRLLIELDKNASKEAIERKKEYYRSIGKKYGVPIVLS